MATLNALKKAPILNEAGVALNAGYTVTSSDTAVASVARPTGSSWYVTGVTAGMATLTATRTLDGAVATLPVEVVAAVPFSISLGAEVPA